MKYVRPLSFGLLSAALATMALAKEPGPRALDLENAIVNADLIVAVRLTDVSERTVIHGGKEARSTQQFTFEPVRTLKGLFSRDTLKLTNDDLGTDQFSDRPASLEKGQLRMLLLGRSGRGYANSNRAGALDLSLPLLADRDDPLFEAVRVLIKVTQETDRARKVEGLRDGLKTSRGRASIPLLHALGRRAMLAAQTAGTMATVARALGDESFDVRETAAETARAIIEADYLHQKPIREEARVALLVALEKAGVKIATRVALIDALALAGDPTRDAQAPWIEYNLPKLSFAERAARLRAIGHIDRSGRHKALASELAELPLDAPDVLDEAIEQSLIRLAKDQAARPLIDRIEAKHAAGLDVSPDIDRIVDLPPASAASVLLQAAKLPLDVEERIVLATAAERAPDPRLVPILATMLDPRVENLRWRAIAALLKIDTDEAARVLRAHLSEEGNLARKLEIAEFLGRHQIRDGYPYAIEHMSELHLRDQAVAALAAIREPKALGELHQILKSSNDLEWNRAAIRALGRLGEKGYSEQFLVFARNLHHPECQASILALADLGDPALLPILSEAFSSRNDEIVTTAARATGTLLSRPNVKADDLRDRLAALLADVDASQQARSAALESLAKLGDVRIHHALAVAVRDGRIEGSGLLAQVERQVVERKVVLANQ
ncbi:MAG: hypothetical protein ACHRXM_30645 [Isosphaerales bacterium]